MGAAGLPGYLLLLGSGLSSLNEQPVIWKEIENLEGVRLMYNLCLEFLLFLPLPS